MFDFDQLVRPNIRALVPYSSARDESFASDGVFLDANENPFGTLNRYPDPYQRTLKSKLSELKKVSDENIFVGNGSDEGIDLIFRIFCQPGQDKALTFSPTYGMYSVSADINDTELIEVPLTSEFQIDRPATEPHFSDSNIKVIFICSPNNPTGNLLNKKDIDWLLNSFNGMVMIDEAYIDFADTPSWTLALDKYPNLIVSQTMSKAWGLASVRVGMAYASSRVIALLNKVKPPYNVSELNQKAAIEALENKDVFDKNVQTLLDEKARVQTELNNINSVIKIHPSDANFLLVEFKKSNGIYKSLVGQMVITRNRSKLIDNCLRITIGSPSENDQFLKALKKIEQ